MNKPRFMLVFALLFLILPLSSAIADPNRITLEDHPIEIVYNDRSERVANRVHEICRDVVDDLALELGLETITPIEVVVADDMRPYRHALGNRLPVWGVAFALLNEQRIVVDVKRASNAWNSLERVIPHELSHILLAQKVGPVPMPIWFVEGMAKWQAREWSMVDSWQLMNTVWGHDTPVLMRLVDRYPKSEADAQAAYRISYAAFTDLFGSDIARLPEFLDLLRAEGDFLSAFRIFFGKDLSTYSIEFQNGLESKYHSRLLMFQSGPLFGFASVLFLLIVIRYQWRKRRKLKNLERQEQGLSLDDPGGDGV